LIAYFHVFAAVLQSIDEHTTDNYYQVM